MSDGPVQDILNLDKYKMGPGQKIQVFIFIFLIGCVTSLSCNYKIYLMRLNGPRSRLNPLIKIWKVEVENRLKVSMSPLLIR